jgi:hypothetical protein
MVQWIRPVLLLLALAGCTATAQIPDGVEFRSENWYQAIESGFAVAPTSALQTVTEPTDATAKFTNHFHLGLLTSLPGTSLVSPSTTLYRLETDGEQAFGHFHAARRALAEGQPTDRADLLALSRALEHRYLLLSWIDEGVAEGIDDMVHDVYSSVESSEDVRRFAYEEVQGRATAVVLDLWENEVLWRGAADYSTARLYGDDGAIRRELDKTRAAAAQRLAGFMSLL